MIELHLVELVRQIHRRNLPRLEDAVDNFPMAAFAKDLEIMGERIAIEIAEASKQKNNKENN